MIGSKRFKGRARETIVNSFTGVENLWRFWERLRKLENNINLRKAMLMH
jgi:hypothetical protein